MEIKAKYRDFRHISAVLGTLVGAPMVLDVRKIVRYTYPILRPDNNPACLKSSSSAFRFALFMDLIFP